MEALVELVRQVSVQARRIEQLETQQSGRVVMLAAPLTSASWTGTAKTTAANGTIDVSSVFGLATVARALLMRMLAQDESVGVVERLGPSSDQPAQFTVATQAVSQHVHGQGWVTCDENGDVYWSCTDELDAVTLQVWGYLV